jgi:hypothetical protein
VGMNLCVLEVYTVIVVLVGMNLCVLEVYTVIVVLVAPVVLLQFQIQS